MAAFFKCTTGISLGFGILVWNGNWDVCMRIRSESHKGCDCCPQQRSRWLRSISHTHMDGCRIRDTCERQGHLGAKHSGWRPKQKWKARAGGGAHKENGASSHSRNVVNNLATATTMEGRFRENETAQLMQACQRCCYKNKAGSGTGWSRGKIISSPLHSDRSAPAWLVLIMDSPFCFTSQKKIQIYIPP